MKRFKIEIHSEFEQWDRYNVFATAVCYDKEGQMTDYVNLVDKNAALETPPSERAEVYVYIVAREFPASDVISLSPPFEVEILTGEIGGPLKPNIYEVNQWGGLSAKIVISDK